jgi:DNA (cytosine-5)-methyltransferase 1
LTITFGSLFAGIGGMDLGLERAGMVCRWQVEIDDYCRRVLTKHWPDVPKYGDIREVTGEGLERVDLICGGFPCQDISSVGKRAGITGKRSGLWSEYIRLVRVLRPRYVLVENVAALLGRGLGTVLGDLAESGYGVSGDCIPAAALGAPHLRERVFLLGFDTDAAGHGDRPLGDVWQQPSCLEPLALGRRTGSATWWETEPPVDRVADGVPRRVDRIRGLGNAVVPQVAEWIGRRIIEAA